jgi:hypothetical protein
MNVNASNMPSLELANNALTAKMIYESQRLKYDSQTGTKIFAAGKNSTNSKNAINDINTIYTGHKIYTQLTLACAKLEFDLIEKIIALGADVNLSPLNYYLENKDDSREMDEGLSVFHKSPLYELINAMINIYSTSRLADIDKIFKNTIKLFINKGAKFTYNIPYSLENTRSYNGTLNRDDYKPGFEFYTKDLEFPLKFLLFQKRQIYMGDAKDTLVSKEIYKLICQAFSEDSSPNKDMTKDAKTQFLHGDLSVLGDPLQKTFLDNSAYKVLFKNSECESTSKGGSRSRKNRKNSKKRNARRSKTLKR